MPPRPPRLAVHAALISVQFGFATLAVVGKLAFRHIPPDGVVFARVLAAALVFLAWQAAAGRPLLVARADWARVAGLALLGVVINQVLFLRGLALTTAINATVIGTSIPVFAVLIALLLGRERRRWALLAGVPLALGGVLHLIGAEAFRTGGSTMAGDLMIVGNAASYALFLVLGRAAAQQYGAMRMMSTCFVVATLVIAPLGAVDLLRALPTLPGTAWLALAWIVAVPTIYVYVANTWAMSHASSSVVAVYIYLQPVGATLLAVPMLGESLSPRTALAATLVFSGIALVTWPGRAPARTAAR